MNFNGAQSRDSKGAVTMAEHYSRADEYTAWTPLRMDEMTERTECAC